MVSRRLLSFVVAGVLIFTGVAAAGVNQWTPLGPDAAGAVHALVVTQGPWMLYAGADLGVFRSADDGAHWSSVSAGLPQSEVLALAADPSRPSTLYAGTYSGAYKSTNSGASWSSVLGGQSIHAVAIDPLAPQTLYAGALDPMDGSSSVRKSTDGGETWSTVVLDGIIAPWSTYVVSFAVDPTVPSTVYAGSYGGAVLKSTDAGETWATVGYGAGRVTSIAIDPTQPSTIYASTVQTVTPMGPGLGSVLKSEDAGASWAPLPGLPRFTFGALTLDPSSPSTVYVGADGAVYRSPDGGQTWSMIGDASTTLFPEALVVDPADPRTIYAASGGVEAMTLGSPGACSTDAATLCLNQGRFRVEVDWQLTPLGPSFRAQAVPVTSESGYFWFFGPNNVELMVKVLDGTAVNGYYWVFYGALSSVQYTVSVTDTLSGQTKTYANPRGNLASVADAKAFPGNSAPPAGGMAARRPSMAPLAAAAEVCQPDTETLCLNGGRFRVQAFFQLTPSGPSYIAKAAPLTADTGYFWFFDDANVELVVKVLDGTPVNGHYWVFYGALSNVQYTIVVTDTETGAVKTYENPLGNLASVADTSAF